MGECCRQPGRFLIDLHELASDAILVGLRQSIIERREHSLDDGVNELRSQDLAAERAQDGGVDPLHQNNRVVLANRLPAFLEREAAVEEHPLPAVRAADGAHGAAADPATRESWQEVMRVDVARPLADRAAARGNEMCLHARQPGPRSIPECLRDDSEIGRVHVHPLVRMPGRLPVPPPTIALSRLVPDDLAVVQRPSEYFVDRRRGPAARAPLLRPRRCRAIRVQRLGDARVADAPGAHFEDAPNDRGLSLVDAPLDVRPFAVRAEDLEVVVAEHTPPGHMASACLPLHCVVRPLPRLLSLELVGERRERQHDLVDGGVQGAFAVLEVEKHADTGLHQLLQRVRGLYRFTTESRFLAHDEHMKPGARLQAVHEPQEPRPVGELGAADAVVDENARVVDRPSFALGVMSRVINLARD